MVGFKCCLNPDHNMINFTSRQLNPYEENDATHDLEYENMVLSLKFLRYYLYGLKCEVFTHHRSLQHVHSEGSKLKKRR